MNRYVLSAYGNYYNKKTKYGNRTLDATKRFSVMRKTSVLILAVLQTFIRLFPSRRCEIKRKWPSLFRAGIMFFLPSGICELFIILN